MIDLQQFDRDGFAIVPPILPEQEIAHLISLIEQQAQADPKRGGVRDVMHRVPELQAVSRNPDVRSIVEQILGPQSFVVRTTLFDKTGAANWKVPWHQDVTIAVKDRRAVEGYGPWSTKEGIVHVQPPTEVLERMLTVRIHLDPCPLSNGALRVMAGSHKLGRINQNDAPLHVSEYRAIACEVVAGGALVMRPLLLHASSPSAQPAHRRVLHFDFATGDLEGGLQWRLRYALPFS
jgi:ectoine hydroxylase-related dioxygenase (phytanoyl-CoA dioxygenase family)